MPETSQDMNFIVGSEVETEKHENPFQTEVFDENTTVTDEGLQTEELIETSDTDKEKVEETNPSNTSHTRNSTAKLSLLRLKQKLSSNKKK